MSPCFAHLPPASIRNRLVHQPIGDVRKPSLLTPLAQVVFIYVYHTLGASRCGRAIAASCTRSNSQRLSSCPLRYSTPCGHVRRSMPAGRTSANSSHAHARTPGLHCRRPLEHPLCCPRSRRSRRSRSRSEPPDVLTLHDRDEFLRFRTSSRSSLSRKFL